MLDGPGSGVAGTTGALIVVAPSIKDPGKVVALRGTSDKETPFTPGFGAILKRSGGIS